MEDFIPTAVIRNNVPFVLASCRDVGFPAAVPAIALDMNDMQAVKASMMSNGNADDDMVPFPDVVRVHFTVKNGKHYTTVQWADNTATTVCLGEGETFDRYAGFSAAVMKKLFGSTTQAKKSLAGLTNVSAANGVVEFD